MKSKTTYIPVPGLSPDILGINISYHEPFGVDPGYICGYVLISEDHPCFDEHYTKINDRISHVFQHGFDYASDDSFKDETRFRVLGFSTTRKELRHYTVTDVKDSLIAIAACLDSV